VSSLTLEAILRAQPRPVRRFQLAVVLDRLSPSRHGATALTAAREVLACPADEVHHLLVIEWMLRQLPSDSFPDLVAYVSTGEARETQRRALQLTVEHLGQRAAPVLLAALARGADDLRLEALALLLDLGIEREAVLEGIERGMARSDPGRVVRFLALAVRYGLEHVPGARALLHHRARAVREAAAQAYRELCLECREARFARVTRRGGWGRAGPGDRARRCR
jgi:hypothetical protein